jgi:glyoxylase-like metal-dependent hydrolase (beta-lactamase superfamily II)
MIRHGKKGEQTEEARVTQDVSFTVADAPWIRVLPLLTPTLPPATHTNTYIIGDAHRRVVIDPASPYPDEQRALDRLLDELGGVELVILTHHHVDHVSGAAHLAARLGVPVAAHRITAEKLDGRITVDRFLDDGERVGGLRALFTPGHAPGHLCFVDEAAGAIVAGDMVASVGTIIVEPDDGGDMAEYLASLARLRTLDGARWLLPAHGPPIADVAGKLDFYVAHRLERERRVIAALSTQPRAIAELVPPVYPDVPPAIHPLAARSLLAHLIKLEREGRAHRVGDQWYS